MIRIFEKINEIKNNNLRMLLQIHDELIFEVPTNDLNKISKLIKDEMVGVKDSNLHKFSIPLLVDVNTGDNWGVLH